MILLLIDPDVGLDPSKHPSTLLVIKYRSEKTVTLQTMAHMSCEGFSGKYPFHNLREVHFGSKIMEIIQAVKEEMFKNAKKFERKKQRPKRNKRKKSNKNNR